MRPTTAFRLPALLVALANRGQADARVFIRHRVASGWTLRDQPADIERLGDDLLIPVHVGAGKTMSLVLVESTPPMRCAAA